MSSNQRTIVSFLTTNSNIMNATTINTSAIANRNLVETSSSQQNTIEITDDAVEKHPLYQALKQRAQLAESKLKHAEIALKKSASLNLQKDLKIESLENQLKKFDKKKAKINEAHRFIFSTNEIKSFQSVGSGSRNDSTFVSRVLIALYKNNTSSLQSKSVRGQKHKNTKKNSLTPEKIQLVTEMLKERIMSESDDSAIVSDRLSKVNIHLKNAIQNNNKKNKVTSTVTSSPQTQMMPQTSTATSSDYSTPNNSADFSTTIANYSYYNSGQGQQYFDL